MKKTLLPLFFLLTACSGSAGYESQFSVVDGKDGKSLLTGNGEPNTSLGEDGDSYIDLDAWTYYTKSNGIWVSNGTIKGDAGVSVVSTTIDKNGDLLVTFSDGTTQNAGHIADKTKYTVNFHVGDEIVKTMVVDAFSQIEAPSKEYTAGYSISSWYMKDSSGNTQWIFDGYLSRVYDDLDLYAEYKANTYTVSFVDEEKMTINDPIIVTYNQEFKLPCSSISGYSYRWLKDDGEEIVDGIWRIPSDLTLYATWENSQYNITLDPNGGNVDDTNILVVFDKTYTLPLPARLNYTFLGWYSSDNIRISSNATWRRTQDEVLIAKWTNVATTYCFDAGDGSCSIEYMVIGWEDSYELPVPTPLKTGLFGYSFVGWYLNDVCIPQSGNSWTYSNEGGILVAKWDYIEPYYPQTLVDDEELISLLNNAKAGTLPTSSASDTWLPYDYYSSDNKRFMWYKDVTYHDKRYRGVYFKKYRSRYADYDANNNSSCSNQPKNGFNIDTVYWFKWEPVKLISLGESDGIETLISKMILDSQPYYLTSQENLIRRKPYDSSEYKEVYDSNYCFSYIRGWLNSVFYNQAFSDEAKETINLSYVDNSVKSTGNGGLEKYICENTNDNIYLLSVVEAKKNVRYFREQDRFGYRLCQVSRVVILLLAKIADEE